MASTTSFKQQCPSCEAMVPIRDPGLIGRKIDCPKCKYRFVVEKPKGKPKDDDESSSDTPAPTKKATKSDAAKPVSGARRRARTGNSTPSPRASRRPSPPCGAATRTTRTRTIVPRRRKAASR